MIRITEPRSQHRRALPWSALTRLPTLHTQDSLPLTPRLRRSAAKPDLSSSQQSRKPPTPAKQPSRPSRLTSSNPLHSRGISPGLPISPRLSTTDHLQHSPSRKQTVGRLPSKGNPSSYHFDEGRKRSTNAQPSRKIFPTSPSSNSQAHRLNKSLEIRPLNHKTIDQERRPETYRKGRLQAQDRDIKPSIQQQSKASNTRQYSNKQDVRLQTASAKQ